MYVVRYLIVTLIWISLMPAAVQSHQSCPTLCKPIDGRQPGSAIPGILQAKTLEWVAISSNAWKWKVKVKSLSRVRLFATSWTSASSVHGIFQARVLECLGMLNILFFFLFVNCVFFFYEVSFQVFDHFSFKMIIFK